MIIHRKPIEFAPLHAFCLTIYTLYTFTYMGRHGVEQLFTPHYIEALLLWPLAYWILKVYFSIKLELNHSYMVVTRYYIYSRKYDYKNYEAVHSGRLLAGPDSCNILAFHMYKDSSPARRLFCNILPITKKSVFYLKTGCFDEDAIKTIIYHLQMAELYKGKQRFKYYEKDMKRL